MGKENLIQILLFAATVLTTLAAGSYLSGGDPLANPSDLGLGAGFSFTLVFILLMHELAHYFTAKAHAARTTLPYFIPAPTLIGTFGAVIKMKSPMPNRSALLDVGISGPAASFVFSIAAACIGLRLSSFTDIPAEGVIRLGDSLIFRALVRLAAGRAEEGLSIMLHPVAFAGWLGFLVTALNLIPAGQLDGGHIMYAMTGEKFPPIAGTAVIILAAMGFFWRGWFLWAFLLLMLGLNHPPPIDPSAPPGRKRKAAAIAGLLIFAVTFVPVPIQ